MKLPVANMFNCNQYACHFNASFVKHEKIEYCSLPSLSRGHTAQHCPLVLTGLLQFSGGQDTLSHCGMVFAGVVAAVGEQETRAPNKHNE